MEDAFEEVELAERAEENFLLKIENVLATFQSNKSTTEAIHSKALVTKRTTG